jgi:hypothetical protein
MLNKHGLYENTVRYYFQHQKTFSSYFFVDLKIAFVLFVISKSACYVRQYLGIRILICFIASRFKLPHYKKYTKTDRVLNSVNNSLIIFFFQFWMTIKSHFFVQLFNKEKIPTRHSYFCCWLHCISIVFGHFWKNSLTFKKDNIQISLGRLNCLGCKYILQSFNIDIQQKNSKQNII